MVAMGERSGPFKYPRGEYRRNHVVWPGQEAALEKFVRKRHQSLGMHKLAHAHSSHSEDALTWSCFHCLAQVDPAIRRRALGELWEIAYDGATLPDGVADGKICIGSDYGAGGESTEVDASIDGERALTFVEAKLYSAMSQADLPRKPHNQLAKKLRIGVQAAMASNRDFYFILLDLAPRQMLRRLNPGVSLDEATKQAPGGFASKWLTAYWFDRYHHARGGSLAPLREVLQDIPRADPTRVANHMGWLTWADLFKVVLRAVVDNR